MTEEERSPEKKKWGIVRIGAYAAAVIPMITLAGYLVNAAVQISLMQTNVQNLVDAQAFQTAASEARRGELQSLRSDMKQLQGRFQITIDTLSEVINTQSKNVEVLAELQATEDRDPSPAIKFPRTGHKIADGRVGDFVQMTFTYFKMRECGAPKLDLYFINGSGIRHRFARPSILDADGRGVNSEVNLVTPQTISYVSQIPANDGVTSGDASGWVEVSYPELCPAVKTAASPVLSFTILE